MVRTDTVLAVGRQEEAAATATLEAADRVDTIVLAAALVHRTLVNV